MGIQARAAGALSEPPPSRRASPRIGTVGRTFDVQQSGPRGPSTGATWVPGNRETRLPLSQVTVQSEEADDRPTRCDDEPSVPTDNEPSHQRCSSHDHKGHVGPAPDITPGQHWFG